MKMRGKYRRQATQSAIRESRTQIPRLQVGTHVQAIAATPGNRVLNSGSDTTVTEVLRNFRRSQRQGGFRLRAARRREEA